MRTLSPILLPAIGLLLPWAAATTPAASPDCERLHVMLRQQLHDLPPAATPNQLTPRALCVTYPPDLIDHCEILLRRAASLSSVYHADSAALCELAGMDGGSWGGDFVRELETSVPEQSWTTTTHDDLIQKNDDVDDDDANDVLLDKMFTQVIKGALTEVDDYDKKSLPTEDPVRMTANAKWRGKLGQLEKSAITKQGYTEDVADKVVGRFGLNDREDDSSPYDTMDEGTPADRNLKEDNVQSRYAEFNEFLNGSSHCDDNDADCESEPLLTAMAQLGTDINQPAQNNMYNDYKKLVEAVAK